MKPDFQKIKFPAQNWTKWAKMTQIGGIRPFSQVNTTFFQFAYSDRLQKHLVPTHTADYCTLKMYRPEMGRNI